MVDLRKKHPAVLALAFDISPPEGWEAIVDRLIERMKIADPRVQVSQIKEKFASLRVYHDGGEDLENMVKEANAEARRTCESCGKPGRKRGKSWIAIRCDEHTGDLE